MGLKYNDFFQYLLVELLNKFSKNWLTSTHTTQLLLLHLLFANVYFTKKNFENMKYWTKTGLQLNIITYAVADSMFAGIKSTKATLIP